MHILKQVKNIINIYSLYLLPQFKAVTKLILINSIQRLNQYYLI